MKKLLLLLTVVLSIGLAKAESYKVTITSLVEYIIIDNNTNEVLDQGTESPSNHVYTIETLTPDMARNEAYERCSRACNSNWVVQDYNYYYQGKSCTKKVRQIPGDSEVQTNR